MDQQPSTSGIGEKKKPKMKVFQEYWLSIDTFKHWLIPHDNNKKALCTACNKVLACSKTDLNKHSKTKTHVNKIKSRNVIPSALQPKLKCSNNYMDHVNKVKTAEIKLAAFFAEHNIAFQIVDHMVPLLKEIVSDPQVLHDLKLSRKKLYVICIYYIYYLYYC